MDFDPDRRPGCSDEMVRFAVENGLQLVQIMYISADQVSDPDKSWIIATKFLPRIGDDVSAGRGKGGGVVERVVHTIVESGGPGLFGTFPLVIIRPPGAAPLPPRSGLGE